MFRRAFTSATRIAAGLGVVRGGTAAAGFGLFSATTLAVTNAPDAGTKPPWSDEEMKKHRPFWYQEIVWRLERALTKFSTYTYMEDPDVQDDAIDILQRVEDVKNCEVSWRLGRAYVEKANLFGKTNTRDRREHLEKAILFLERALELEPARGSAGLHKWYALALQRWKENSPYTMRAMKAKKFVYEHLQKAAELDPKDPITQHLIGVFLYKDKKYAEALKYFRRVEEIKPDFYAANWAYLGLSLAGMGRREEATPALLKAMFMNIQSKPDREGRVMARAHLELVYRIPKSQLVSEDY